MRTQKEEFNSKFLFVLWFPDKQQVLTFFLDKDIWFERFIKTKANAKISFYGYVSLVIYKELKYHWLLKREEQTERQTRRKADN